jgi:uncharacterized protein (DUF2062 family)
MFNKLKKRVLVIRTKIKQHGYVASCKKLLSSRSSPHQLAMGASIGVFLSVLPTFGLGMLIALLISWKAKFNILSTYIGTLITNPLTASIIYIANYSLGSVITGAAIVPSTGLPSLTFASASKAALQLYTGGLVLAFLASISCYSLVYFAAVIYQGNNKKIK